MECVKGRNGEYTLKDRIINYSVLMTVYEKEKPENLNKSLSSLENQTLLPNEIIIVEDGQLGDSLNNVITRHKTLYSSIYKVICLKENHGRGYASRIGINYVSNDWVARMDSDDISYQNRFELQINAINKYISRYPKLAAVGGQIAEFMDGNEKSITGYRKVPLEPKKITKFAAYRSPINNATVMINKKALLSVGSYSRLNVLEDYDLWVRLLANGYELLNIKECLVKVRVSSEMYKRRGGIKYFLQYLGLKIHWQKLGVGTKKSVFVSVFYMMCNIILPVKIRKMIYKKFLREKN